jgi:hypothetical protein
MLLPPSGSHILFLKPYPARACVATILNGMCKPCRGLGSLCRKLGDIGGVVLLFGPFHLWWECTRYLASSCDRPVKIQRAFVSPW